MEPVLSLLLDHQEIYRQLYRQNIYLYRYSEIRYDIVLVGVTGDFYRQQYRQFRW